MDDLFAKMQEILNTDEGREQLKSVAEMLGGTDGQMPDLSELGNLFGGSASPQSDESTGQNEAPPPESNDSSGGSNTGGGFDFFSNIDINTILQMQQIFNTMNQEDDNTKLLLALKPHFSDRRKEKVDQAVKIMHLLSLLPLIKDSGLLGGLFGDGRK